MPLPPGVEEVVTVWCNGKTATLLVRSQASMRVRLPAAAAGGTAVAGTSMLCCCRIEQLPMPMLPLRCCCWLRHSPIA